MRLILITFLIGEAIKWAREAKNLTQEQLGELMGVKRAQISKNRKWEKYIFFYYCKSIQGNGRENGKLGTWFFGQSGSLVNIVFYYWNT